MNLNPFKKSYRVLEVKMGNDRSNFYPQVKRWVVLWKPIIERVGDGAVKFGSLKKANNYLYERYREDRSKQIVGTETHKFNEVFHKLQNTNTGDHGYGENDGSSRW